MEVKEKNGLKYPRPCPHCGKENENEWCYEYKDKKGQLYSVCKRGSGPGWGWKETNWRDKEEDRIYVRDESVKLKRSPGTKEWIYKDGNGGNLVKVIRKDSADGKRQYFQQHWNGEKWVSGLGNIDRTEIPIYKLDEIKQAIAAKKPIFIAEGEGCADILASFGFAATTNIRGAGKWKDSDTGCLMGATAVILVPDRDRKGLGHMELVEQQLSSSYPNIQIQWLYPFPNSDTWFDLPKDGGLDVADWVSEWEIDKETLLLSISEKRPITEIEADTAPSATENLILRAIATLYSDRPWMSLDGTLYHWTGTHYEAASKEEQLARIWEWLENTPVQIGGNWICDPTPAKCNRVYESVAIKFGIDPKLVNPPGLNCLNGVVRLRWTGMVAEPKLIPHDSSLYYTYVSEITYRSPADESECDRLLQCLEPPQQRILLQTLAASLDLESVRKYRGRMVRAILCQGQGNNGKDAVREVVRTIYGALANASLSDFQAYDGGRKFTLSKLDGVAVNWCSENTQFTSLDNLQSLKAAITGDPLDMEKKGRDERAMTLNTVFLFNINKAPLLKGGLEAIKSRWAVLDFAKTFKTNADTSKGEIEAEPRFRYDPEFIKTQVAPAFLNKMLRELQNLCKDGINYEPTDSFVRDIKSESNHLWRFCYETGLDYCEDGRAYISDIWDKLETWYRENGTLEISDDGKKIWHDQPRRGDKNCKAVNQVCARFVELFPKAKRLVDRSHQNKIYLSGIQFSDIDFVDNSVSNSPTSPASPEPDAGKDDQQKVRNCGLNESSEPVWAEKPSTAVKPPSLKEKLPSHCPPTAVELPSNCPTDSGNQWGPEEVTDLAEMMRNIESIEELDAFLDTFKEQDEYVKKARNELSKLDYDAYRMIDNMMQQKSPYSQTVEEDNQLLVDDSKLDLDYQPEYQVKPYFPTQNLQPYNEVKKLYLDIETTGLDPKESRAIAIGLWDGINKPILITDRDEKALLKSFVEVIERLQPELVIGHNVVEFDLPFLKTRGSWCGVQMPFRNEMFPASGAGAACVPPIMEKTITSSSMNGKPIVYHPIRWEGVQIIDTMQQAAIYEKSANSLTSFSLKNLVIDLGLRSDRRIELTHQEILQLWESGNTNKILEYLKFDLEDTKLLADFFIPQVYYQLEVVPMSLQELATASPAKKWEMILENYYRGTRKRYRIPLADEKLRYEGGYVDVNPGLYQNVAKIDVSSMYPSIQLLYGLCSRKDSDRHYLSVLQYLKDARLELKQKYKETGDKKFHAQQNAFKILINGGYGFSGTGGYPYNCMQTAALVTAYGRRLIKLMVGTLESSGATVIEVDTDGIFFAHPEPDNCLEIVQRSLPQGIYIELEAKNCSIYVPRKKNYIIYKPDGSVKVSGQFRSRNRCQLFKDFVVKYVRLMLQSSSEADAYYNNICEELALGNYPISELSITQRIPRGDKALQENDLGKIGDIVTYWWSGHVTKRGAIKRKPTNSEPYLPEFYTKELSGLKKLVDEVVNQNVQSEKQC